ncbi:MAG: ComEC/Rec2 family competence protein [Chloroflexi bacterium]|nr:ComEC/Rec2 family competence protein [Chloroflexota bacterium]
MILAWLVGAFVVGVITGSWATVPLPISLAGAVLLSAAAYVLRRRKTCLALTVAAAFALGLARAPSPAAPHSPGDLRYYNGRYVALQGVVAEEPDVRDTGINYVVSVSSIVVGGRARPISGRLQLHMPRSQQFDYGDELSLQGTLLPVRNTSRVPYRDILANRGIYSEMSFVRVTDLGPTATGPAGWLVRLRQRLEAGIDAWLPEPEAALLIAITLGARSASLGDLTPALIATGLVHIIAISGIKVAMVAGTLHQLARLLSRRLVALVVSLAGVAAYVLLTGATASGTRSGLMWAMVFLATYLGRPTVALVSLGFVAALMVFFDPSLPWDTGFQLSAVGTLSIVSFAEPIGQFFAGGAPPGTMPARPDRAWTTIANRLLGLVRVPSPFREALSVTIAAQIGTLPIVIVGFHLVSGLGAVANALVLPLVPILILLGFALGAASSLVVIASPLGGLAYALLHTIVWLSRWLASLPAASPGALPPLAIALYYLTLGGIARVVLRRANWVPRGEMPHRAREVTLALVVAAAALTVSLAVARDDPRARLYYLGTGEAILLRSEGMTVLIDGSPRPLQLLERLDDVLPYEVRAIDLVIVTDPRAGNVVGLQAVLAHYAVSEVLDVGAQYPSATYARWRATLRQERIPAYALRTGTSVRAGAVSLTALGPDAPCPQPTDCVGLLRLADLHRSVLLAGDSSAREQREALFRPVSLRADTLFLDLARPTDPGFVRAVTGCRMGARCFTFLKLNSTVDL